MGHDTVLKARTASAAVQQYGYSRQEFLNRTTLEIRPKADIPELLRRTLNPPPQGPSRAEKWRHQPKNGTVFPAAITSWELTVHGRHGELVLARRDSNDRKCGRALQDYYDSSGHSQYLAAVAGIAESD
jgi:PAS domain S-box-containing protein